MTLRDLMSSDVTDVFLVTDDFAEDIIRYPKSVVADAETITVVVDGGRLEGTREVSGDGRQLHQLEGTKLRDSLLLEMPRSQEINYPDGMGHGFDQFLIDGKIYNAKRDTSEDKFMQTVLVVRPQTSTTRKTQQRG